LVRDLTGQPGAGAVELRHQVLGAVVRLRDGRRVERVGGGDVRPGGEVLPVDVTDHVRAGQLEEVEVTAVAPRGVGSVEAEVVLGQVDLLEHRAPGPVEDQDALACQRLQVGTAHVLPLVPRLWTSNRSWARGTAPSRIVEWAARSCAPAASGGGG